MSTEQINEENIENEEKLSNDSNSSLNVTYEEIGIISKEKQNENTNFESGLFSKNTHNIITNHQDFFSMNLINLNNINDEMSDSGYMNRNFETSLDEIFENLNYYLTSEKKKIKIEKDNLNKTIQNFIEFNSNEKNKIEKKKEKWKKNLKIASDMIVKNDDIVDLDIGGTYKISTSRLTLTKYPNSLLAKMFSGKKDIPCNKGRFFIDRDGDAFINLLYFLRNNKIPYLTSQKDQQSLQEELEYWQIPFRDTKKKKSVFTFDPEWMANTLSLNSTVKILKQKNVQHGIVFCKPTVDAVNNYIEFCIIIRTPSRGKSHLFMGVVDKSKYKYENLISTFWKDSPSSFYWDIWNTKLIKTDENGVQVRSINGYGCKCESMETILGMKYDDNNKTLTFFKNGINLGVAFKDVPNGLTPALDIWFEEGSIEIVTNSNLEINNFL